MKIRLLGIVFTCGLFFSCSKEKQPQSQNQTQNQTGTIHKVNLTLTGFTEQITGNPSALRRRVRAHSLRASDISSSDMVVLYYLIYNSSGSLLHSIKETASQSNFGSVADSLADGTTKLCYWPVRILL